MALLLLSAFFIFGALTVVAVEAVGFWYLIRCLNRKIEREQIKSQSPPSGSFPGDLNPSFHDKQGSVWILTPDKVPKLKPEDKRFMDNKKRKKEILEVTPVRKNARIRDRFLVLTESDGSCAEILLKGCAVAAVSGTNLSSRKWAKRYPIRVENKDSAIYKGHNIIYFYLETSWEKESWCKALRLASCNNEDKIAWFSKLNVGFQNYLAALNDVYPSSMKPTTSSNAELIDKSIKLDNSSSKVRQFLRKLTKKASKSGLDYKANDTLISGHGERIITGRSRSFQDVILMNELAKINTAGNVPSTFSDDASVTSSISEAGAGSHSFRISDADSKLKCSDEGSLCLNVLISRLFFDANNNLLIKSFIQSRVQRALPNMRIPSYIGEITCTSVDPGSLPPHILAMRVLPSNMNEMLSLEIDVEYLGGMVVELETRLEIQEFEKEEKQFDKNNVGEVNSDMLDGFGSFGEALRISEGATGVNKQERTHYTDDVESSKINAQPSSQSRWKSILQSINKQVSQVSLSLGIKVSSLTGTIQLYIKPPPSDQIWFGFTSMPDIQLNVESFVGAHKITSDRLALFLISRFKAAIREALVLPNTEYICIPWMLAEKEDWIPRKDAPFMWYRQTHETNHGTLNKSEANHEKSKTVGRIPETICESSDSCASSSHSMDEATLIQELKHPLLEKEKTPPWIDTDKKGILVPTSPRILEGLQERGLDNNDGMKRLTRMGTRERMRGLGKKMGEKLEVKKRHLEEKGRSFVEKMMAP